MKKINYLHFTTTKLATQYTINQRDYQGTFFLFEELVWLFVLRHKSVAMQYFFMFSDRGISGRCSSSKGECM